MQTAAYPHKHGQWQIRRARLLCRLPDKTVRVTAPAALLQELARQCDGTRTWAAVVGALARRWSRPEVVGFLLALEKAGGIVDAADGPPAQASEGWPQVIPLPPVAPASADHVYAAGPILVDGRPTFATGRSEDAHLAAVKAEAEAWERLGWATLGECVAGEMRAVMFAMDPRSVVAYSELQYADAAFPFPRFSARSSYLWCTGVEPATGKRVRLPAECIHSLSALPQPYRSRAVTSTSTSGAAAWTDQEGALRRATLELVERHAFLRHWLLRQAPDRIHGGALPAALRSRAKRLREAGYTVQLSFLQSDLVPVAAVFLQHDAEPFTAITAAADFDAEAALTRAMQEAEGRAAHALAFPASPIRAAADVCSLHDINRYYQSRRHFRGADFFAVGPTVASCAPPPACTDWSSLCARLAAKGLRLLAFDITPRAAFSRRLGTPLHVVRAAIPGLLPIWFAHGLQPAGLPMFPRLPRRSAGAFIHPFT